MVAVQAKKRLLLEGAFSFDITEVPLCTLPLYPEVPLKCFPPHDSLHLPVFLTVCVGLQDKLIYYLLAFTPYLPLVMVAGVTTQIAVATITHAIAIERFKARAFLASTLEMATV